MKRLALLLGCAALAFAIAGCKDNTTAPRHTAPAAPRGVYSLNGDRQVTLYWYPNTEATVSEYRIYQSPCESGSNCPYTRVTSVSAAQDSAVVTGLTNGTTRYFAVSAVDQAGYESDLSYETVWNTPRPAGYGATVVNYRGKNFVGAAWDFSAGLPVSYWSPQADIVYSDTLGYQEMYAVGNLTDIQDAGYTTSLDGVAFAPAAGWSPTGSVQLIPGHTYVVWTRDNNFGKFRVTSLTHTAATFDWAYQTDAGNSMLRARHAGHGAANARQAGVTQR